MTLSLTHPIDKSLRADQLPTKPELIIYGTGAMAGVYASYFSASFQIKAYTVEQKYRHANEFAGLPLYPFESIADYFNPRQHALVVAVGYSDMNQIRARISDQARELGFQMASFIAPDLWLHSGVRIQPHCVVLDHCSIHANSEIGENTFISSGVHIGHDCKIGKNVWINSGVVLAGGVSIGHNCFLGINSSVAHGVAIAEGTFIGANTLVTSPTEANQVVVSKAGEIYPVESRVFLALMEANNAT